jgi:hypothetical protein
MLPIKFLILVSLYALRPSHPEMIRWRVDKTSTLSIAGSTNINHFCCEVTEYTGPDTLTTLKGSNLAETPGIVLKGALRINIADFDCSNRMMTSEFKHTLKYQQYPQLIITFLSLEKLPSATTNESVKGWVAIDLAGTCRKFELDYSSCRGSTGDILLIGARTFGFSDFGLTPPRKMAGLVRVNDRLDVRFRLHLHQLNQ